MRLVGLSLTGYRRFARARINLDAPVVAVIGPNQAGKSSLLDALLRLHDKDAFTERDRHRSKPPADEDVILRALFRLDEGDRSAIANVPGGSAVRFFEVARKANGERTFRTDPDLRRPRALRGEAAAGLKRASTSRWLADVPDPGGTEADDHEEDDVTLSSRCANLADQLAKAGENLKPRELGEADALAEVLDGALASSHRARLASLLAHLVSEERSTHPHQAAIDALSLRVPEIAWYGDKERELLPDYNLADDSTWNQAARNLAALAGTSMEELAAVRNDAARTKNVLDPANRKLEKFFSEYWTQAPINVALHLIQERLEVLTERRVGKWSSIGESSDGMRAFVALLAYSRRFSEEPRPVFLVDEAERHLHYDAQADLVRVFETQPAAAQVIYTTHSLGCLPEDLGRGLRAISPIPGTDESEIVNWTWELGKGLEPVALAVGASALAFVAARYAVLAEGGTEATLLPTLLREANQLDRLPYQVLPGLSQASPDVIGRVKLDAVHLVYLIDGDAGGREKEQYLLKLGLRRESINVLGGRWSGGTIEDLVQRDKYLQALGEELKDRHAVAFDAGGKLPDTGRARFVDQWCKRRGIRLSHPAVAARLLEAEPPLVPRGRRGWLRKLHSELLQSLDIPGAAS